ncbi:MAG: AzlD domain-containing protein [Clostridia bacterium]|nr:AzlD domain-containing protein [Clostridia bacterium]
MTVSPHFFLYLAVMAGVTYLIRLLPLLFVRKRIKNRFIRSFLYYVPYAVLSAMAFPAIFFATGNIISGVLAAAVCITLGLFKRGLVTVAAGGALTVLISELVIMLI